jgi:hypothetical protein
MKRKHFLFGLCGLLLLISLSLSKTYEVLAGPPIPPSPPPELVESLTPSQTSTPTSTNTPTATLTPTITRTSTVTFTSAVTYDVSKLYPMQDDTLNTQAQLKSIQDSITELQGYLETSQPKDAQIQDALNAIKDALRTAEQEAKIDSLNQKITGWIQFAAGLVLGAILGWVEFEPSLPKIKLDVIADKIRQVARKKGKPEEKGIDKKVGHLAETGENNDKAG